MCIKDERCRQDQERSLRSQCDLIRIGTLVQGVENSKYLFGPRENLVEEIADLPLRRLGIVSLVQVIDGHNFVRKAVHAVQDLSADTAEQEGT